MLRNYDYVRFDKVAETHSGFIKEAVEALHYAIEELLPEGREKSLALTRLEEVWMRCGRALRDDVIRRNPEAPNLPERSDE